MIRLAHRISCTDVCSFISMNEGRETELRIWKSLRRVQSNISKCNVIVADNVAEFYATHSKHIWTLHEDFPCVSPPFEKIFIEWKEATETLLPGGNVHRRSPGGIAGCFIDSHRFDKEEKPPNFPDTEWCLMFHWCGYKNSTPYFTDGTTVVLVDRKGTVIRALFMGGTTKEPRVSDSSRRELISMLFKEEYPGSALHIPLLALSFANCKNVTTTVAGEECEPDQPWVRKNKPPEIKYHILNINPMKEVLRTEGGSDVHGLPKALHICRGHFKRYTEEAPRFGRDVGTFWCPSHVRGNVENGIVDKDYSIKLGKPISKDSHEEKDNQGNRPQPERPETSTPMDQPDNGDA